MIVRKVCLIMIIPTKTPTIPHILKDQIAKTIYRKHTHTIAHLIPNTSSADANKAVDTIPEERVRLGGCWEHHSVSEIRLESAYLDILRSNPSQSSSSLATLSGSVTSRIL